MPGYELKKQTCLQCPAPTVDMNGPWCYNSCKKSNCTTCFLGDILTDMGKFFPCPSGVFDGKQCRECPDKCNKCKLNDSGKVTCTECWGVFDGKRCRECPDNCNKCKLNDLGRIMCTECAVDDPGAGVFNDFVQGKCVNQCSNYCTACKRDGGGKVQCADCSVVSGRDKNNVCVPCPDHKNCLFCGWTGKEMDCTDCPEGVLYDGSCLECPQGCETCSVGITQNDLICTKCYWHSILLPNGTCQYCPKNCDTCALEEDRLTCKNCSAWDISDHHFSIVHGECVQCSDGCLECEEVNGTLTCIKCEENHALVNGTCRDLACGNYNCHNCALGELGNISCTSEVSSIQISRLLNHLCRYYMYFHS